MPRHTEVAVQNVTLNYTSHAGKVRTLKIPGVGPILSVTAEMMRYRVSGVTKHACMG